MDSITNLAIRAGILLDVSGRVIPDTFASRGTIVGKVDQGAVNACDSCLLLEAVRSVSGLVPNQDAPAITHALFKEAPSRVTQEDMIDRVHDVLSTLNGKLDQDKDGALLVI